MNAFLSRVAKGYQTQEHIRLRPEIDVDLIMKTVMDLQWLEIGYTEENARTVVCHNCVQS